MPRCCLRIQKSSSCDDVYVKIPWILMPPFDRESPRNISLVTFCIRADELDFAKQPQRLPSFIHLIFSMISLHRVEKTLNTYGILFFSLSILGSLLTSNDVNYFFMNLSYSFLSNSPLVYINLSLIILRTMIVNTLSYRVNAFSYSHACTSLILSYKELNLSISIPRSRSRRIM